MPEIFGHQVSKPALGAIIGGSGLAIWYAVKQRKAAASSAASSTAIDPVTGLPYSQDQVTDPLTGMTYLAEAQEYGSVSAAEQAVAGAAADDFSSGAGTTGTGSTGTTTTGGTGYTSNAAWAQAVEAGLTDIGYTSTDVSAALGQYLNSLPETSAQAGIVAAALAEYGPPPVGTYTILQASPTPPTGSGSGGTGTSTPPPVTMPPPTSTPTGGSTPSSGGPITVAPSGFRVVNVQGLSITLGWDPLTPPAGEGPLRGYTVGYGQSASSQPYQQQAGPGANGTTITFAAGSGSEGLTHYFTLWADPASSGGPHAGPISAKTA
jgi:hypothetical protein